MTERRRPRNLRLESQGDVNARPTAAAYQPTELPTHTPLSIVRDAKEFLQSTVASRPITRINSVNRRTSASTTPTGLPFEETDGGLVRRLVPSMMRSGFLRQAESAPPTRGVNDAPLSPLRVPSPPRTDPPRRRHRKSKTSASIQSTQVDSPIPSPNGDRRSRPGLGRQIAELSVAPTRMSSNEDCCPNTDADEDLALASLAVEQKPSSVASALASALELVAFASSATEGYAAGPVVPAPPPPAGGSAPIAPPTCQQFVLSGAGSGYCSEVAAPAAAAAAAVAVGSCSDAAACPTDPFSARQAPGLDESQELELQAPGVMENMFRLEGDYWDDAEDDPCNHISPSPRLPGERDRWSGQTVGDRPLGSANRGQRVSGAAPDLLHTHALLGSTISSSSSGPKLAPSVHSGEAESRLEHSESFQVPAGAVRGEKFCWVRGELLGRGSLGFVHRALEARTGELIAVKEVMLDAQDQTDDKFRKSLQNEVDLYKDMQHRRIVAYLGHDYIEGRLYIYLEYMAGNSIAQVLAQFGPLDESLIARYTHNLLEGLEYLHTRDPIVLHRDIKGANILVGIDRTVKLSDFGCSKRSAGTAVHTLRGSIPWMAPEVMKQSGYGRKADMWSLGCVMIEMTTAEAPWGTFDNCLAAMVRIAMSEETPPVPSQMGELCKDFVVSCTRRAPQERPDAVDLLKHDFVAFFNNRSSIDESWG